MPESNAYISNSIPPRVSNFSLQGGFWWLRGSNIRPLEDSGTCIIYQYFRLDIYSLIEDSKAGPRCHAKPANLGWCDHLQLCDLAFVDAEKVEIWSSFHVHKNTLTVPEVLGLCEDRAVQFCLRPCLSIANGCVLPFCRFAHGRSTLRLDLHWFTWFICYESHRWNAKDCHHKNPWACWQPETYKVHSEPHADKLPHSVLCMSDQKVGPQTQQRDLFWHRAISSNQCPVFDSCPAVLHRSKPPEDWLPKPWCALVAVCRYARDGLPCLLVQKHGIFSNNSCRGKTDKVHLKHCWIDKSMDRTAVRHILPPAAMRTGLGRPVAFLIAIILKTSWAREDRVMNTGFCYSNSSCHLFVQDTVGGQIRWTAESVEKVRLERTKERIWTFEGCFQL